MPARHAPVNCIPGTPAAVSDGAVSTIRVNNPSGYEIWLQATATSTPPASRAGGQRLGPFSTLAADLPLADLFPGVGAGPYYIWAFADVATTLAVSHA
jgi:hypothetical protein